MATSFLKSLVQRFFQPGSACVEIVRPDVVIRFQKTGDEIQELRCPIINDEWQDFKVAYVYDDEVSLASSIHFEMTQPNLREFSI